MIDSHHHSNNYHTYNQSIKMCNEMLYIFKCIPLSIIISIIESIISLIISSIIGSFLLQLLMIQIYSSFSFISTSCIYLYIHLSIHSSIHLFIHLTIYQNFINFNFIYYYLLLSVMVYLIHLLFQLLS